MEAFNTLSYRDEVPNDDVYRLFAQACAACGDVIRYRRNIVQCLCI